MTNIKTMNFKIYFDHSNQLQFVIEAQIDIFTQYVVVITKAITCSVIMAFSQAEI